MRTTRKPPPRGVDIAAMTIACACFAGWIVAVVLPTMSWWPGWSTFGIWCLFWGMGLASVILIVVAVIFWRSNAAARAAIAAEASAAIIANRPSFHWIRDPDTTALIPIRNESVEHTQVSQPQRSHWNWATITSVATAFSALAAVVFTGESLSTTEQTQSTESYTAALGQIGTADTPGVSHLETRLGGVYALGLLMLNSPNDQPTIIEVLSGFIRSSASIPADGQCPERPPSLDVQAALSVLAGRNPDDDQHAVIDLEDTCLELADVAYPTPSYRSSAGSGFVDIRGNLDNANLAGADLTDAELSGTSLSGADLLNTNLSYARMDGVNLNQAFVEGANFHRTYGLNLTGTVGTPRR